MSHSESPEYWIDQLQMEAHPEGGYFKEIYRAPDIISSDCLADKYNTDRNYSTSIYFLLKGDQVSKFHRLTSDEIWHFYTGSSLTIHLLEADGKYEQLLVGQDFEKGYRFQQVVPADTWFGATVDDPDSFTLVGCTVAPGFDFQDFELADQADLLSQYPKYSDIIKKLT